MLAGLFLLSVPLVTPYLRGDGNGYYAWLRSAVIDGDLQFENEFRHGDPAFLANTFDANGRPFRPLVTATQHVGNQWSVGAAVLWAPFFLVAHLLVLAMRSLGVDWPADGFSIPYLWLTAFATAFYAFVGILLAYRLGANRLARPRPALLGTLAVWGASSLAVYQFLLPFWPFGAGFFVGAALLTVWARKPGWGLRRWLLLGTLSGLAAIVHPVGAAWALLPMSSLLGLDPGSARERLRAAAIFVGGVVLGSLPQLVGKAIVYGSPLETGYQAKWRFFGPNVFRVLVGSQHGLFSWTPVTALALFGLILAVRRDRRLGVGLLVVFLGMLYMLASYATPEQSSYGNRFFVLFTPGFVLGAATLADAVWDRARGMALALAAALVVWNGLFAFQWSWGLVPKRAPIDWSDMAQNQFTSAPRELVRAVDLFFTDRAALVRHVEDVDLKAIREGDVGRPR